MAKKKDCNGFDKGRLWEKVNGHERDITELKGGQRRMWEAIDKIRNRLPNWAVVVIGILLAMLGWFVKGAL